MPGIEQYIDYNHVVTAREGCPQEIVGQQVGLHLPRWDFNGRSIAPNSNETLEVNGQIAIQTIGFFLLAFDERFPAGPFTAASEFDFDDDTLMKKNCTSGFNWRLIQGSNQLSKHAQGLAFDVNTVLNPYIRRQAKGKPIVQPERATYDPSLPGTFTPEHILVISAAKAGLVWGGSWKSDVTDYQHFGWHEY